MGASSLATPTATLDVLRRHGLYTKKALGQHFLVDDHVVERIIALADIAADDVVLEVGPGIGTLTVALGAVPNAGLVSVERDPALPAVLAETTAHLDRFTLIEGDALEVDLEQLSAPYGPPTALVANLPYNVAATVVLRYFEMVPSLERATIMVQSEVAERMSASPGSKAYGAYTVKLRMHAVPAGRFPVARACFLPPPRVDSTVLRLERSELVDDPELLAQAKRVADAAFAQRRKTIRNSLRATLGVSVDEIDTALAAVGVDGAVRAERLDPELFVRLASALR